MPTVGIGELKEKTSEILRRVRSEGTSFEVTYRGHVVARLVPLRQTRPARNADDFWVEWDRHAAKIGAAWPKRLSAVDAGRQGRDRL